MYWDNIGQLLIIGIWIVLQINYGQQNFYSICFCYPARPKGTTVVTDQM